MNVALYTFTEIRNNLWRPLSLSKLAEFKNEFYLVLYALSYMLPMASF